MKKNLMIIAAVVLGAAVVGCSKPAEEGATTTTATTGTTATTPATTATTGTTAAPATTATTG